MNAALQARVLDGADPVTCRPADLLKPELAALEADVRRQAQEKGITLAENAIDDVLTVALFPQPGLKFLENRHNPAALSRYRRRKPHSQWQKQKNLPPSGVYTVEVEGKAFVVKVSDGGDVSQLTAAAPCLCTRRCRPGRRRHPGDRPAGGHYLEGAGQRRPDGGRRRGAADSGSHEDGNRESAPREAGTVRGIAVKAGDAVAVGDTLMTLA